MQGLIFKKLDQINRSLKEIAEIDDAVSISVGIAFSDRENPEGDVFEDADTALQQAKKEKSGFNKSGFDGILNMDFYEIK